MLFRELTNPVFAFGASHLRKTLPAIHAARGGVGSTGPASKNPMLSGESLYF